MISEAGFVFLAFLTGLGVGGFYFGGLWLTVQRLAAARRPALLTLGSFLARTGVMVASFYVVMDGRWQRLIACLLGFVLVRTVLLHRWARKETHLASR